MDHANGGRAFADGRGYALSGSMSRVSGREYARYTRLVQKRIAIHSPAFRAFAIYHEVATGKNESLLVKFDESFDKTGARRCPNEDEQCRGRNVVRRARLRVA